MPEITSLYGARDMALLIQHWEKHYLCFKCLIKVKKVINKNLKIHQYLFFKIWYTTLHFKNTTTLLDLWIKKEKMIGLKSTRTKNTLLKPYLMFYFVDFIYS